MVSLLRYLKNPEDRTNEQIALYSYLVLKGIFGVEAPAFPSEVTAALQILTHHSLYEIAEGLFRLFAADFPENEQVFIQAFLDMVSEYAQKESADLNRFLNGGMKRVPGKQLPRRTDRTRSVSLRFINRKAWDLRL